MDVEKRIHELRDRLRYIRDIFGEKENENIVLLESKLGEYLFKERDLPAAEQERRLTALEDLFGFVEKKLERTLTPMDRVRIVRHPQRICLGDILENVYDNFTEIGGQDEYSIDPSVVIARAYITRRVGKKRYHQPVMVIGQEKGHGQEFRNGGSVKPWGNAKALHYMQVAETENIPIHTYVFTPGAYPIEDYPGAAQQIARNLYEMSGLTVPVVAVFSEGGSGGAEAIALADCRLMLSHGYYSVISPEGAAAIESRIRQGERVPPESIEKCARKLCITGQENLRFGYVERIVPEPPLGARPGHYDFFKLLRQEVIRATDEIVLDVGGIKLFRAMALRRRKSRATSLPDGEGIYVRWSLSATAREKLLSRRYKKYMRLAQHAFLDRRPLFNKAYAWANDLGWAFYSYVKYDFWGKHQKKIVHAMEEMGAEVSLVRDRVSKPIKRFFWEHLPAIRTSPGRRGDLTQLSSLEDRIVPAHEQWRYISPKAKEDRSVSCPNAGTDGCLDQWAPDLFGDFAGVCSCCGHHFPMEYQWYLKNVFDEGTVHEFNSEVESLNPLRYEGFDLRLEKTKEKTGLKSSCMTFEARIHNIKLVVAMLVGDFQGGTVGAAEGEKIIRAAERARKKHFPFLAYAHGTAGIRIHEGTNGVIQMPRCTMAVRRYMEAGGLYLVLYDTNSYAGPVASFLGCSPYQFAVRSANIGFAGPGVIKETTGIDISRDYHKAYKALSRGHIQGIWDRRELRFNLYQALLTMGGRNLYYK